MKILITLFFSCIKAIYFSEVQRFRLITILARRIKKQIIYKINCPQKTKNLVHATKQKNSAFHNFFSKAFFVLFCPAKMFIGAIYFVNNDFLGHSDPSNLLRAQKTIHV